MRDLFRSPAHPYTRGLVASMPVMDGPRQPLQAIAGSVPQAAAMPPGCRFAPRCTAAMPACAAGVPPTVSLGPERSVACLLQAPEQRRHDERD